MANGNRNNNKKVSFMGRARVALRGCEYTITIGALVIYGRPAPTSFVFPQLPLPLVAA
jgi:hypothetical protein